MKYSYNITFVVAPQEEARLLHYLHGQLIPELEKGENAPQNPDLKKVIEIGGEKPDPEHGLSVALSVGFDSEEKARTWYADVLLAALTSFHEEFGDQGMYFITMLEHGL